MHCRFRRALDRSASGLSFDRTTPLLIRQWKPLVIAIPHKGKGEQAPYATVILPLRLLQHCVLRKDTVILVPCKDTER